MVDLANTFYNIPVDPASHSWVVFWFNGKPYVNQEREINKYNTRLLQFSTANMRQYTQPWHDPDLPQLTPDNLTWITAADAAFIYLKMAITTLGYSGPKNAPSQTVWQKNGYYYSASTWE